MARPVVAALLLGGCFHAPGYSPQRSVATWREMQSAEPASPSMKSRTDAGGDALTADEAYAYALRNNPELAVAEAEADVIAAEVGAARQIDNPQLRLTNFGVDDAVRGAPGLNLGFRAPIPRPGTVRARVQGARLAAEGAQGQTEAARRLLRAQIDRHYARLAMLRADLEEVTRAASLGDDRQKQVRERVERQVGTRVDLALADLARAEAVDEASRLRDDLASTEAELARVIGPGAPRKYHVDPAVLRVADLELDQDALTERALRSRPELRATQTRVGQAAATVYLERSKAWPWLSWAQVGYAIGSNAATIPVSFGLALDLPIFSWNRGEIRAARAVQRQRELEERAGVANVASEVSEALARVERATARIAEIEESLLPTVDEAVRQAEAALAAGALDPVTAGEVAARRVSARRLHLAAMYERRDAIISLEAAVGGPLSKP